MYLSHVLPEKIPRLTKTRKRMYPIIMTANKAAKIINSGKNHS